MRTERGLCSNRPGCDGEYVFYAKQNKKKKGRETTVVQQNTLKLINRCTEKPSRVRLRSSRGHELNLFCREGFQEGGQQLCVDGLRADERIGRRLGLWPGKEICMVGGGRPKFNPRVREIPWKRGRLATHCSILTCRMHWAEKPGWLQSTESQSGRCGAAVGRWQRAAGSQRPQMVCW